MATQISTVLSTIGRLGLDTAPIIYFVERNADFYPLCVPFFQAVANGTLTAATSMVSLAETLVHPVKNNDQPRINAFRGLLLVTAGITTVDISQPIAERTAGLRAKYTRLRTMDAIQLATAIEAGCDTFLTNDADLKRVTEIKVLVVGELTL